MLCRLLMLLSMLLALPVLAQDAPAPAVSVSEDTKASIVGSGNDFASDLYNNLRRHEGNVFFSLESIGQALAMTYSGASGQTANEMQSLLHLRMDNDHTYATMSALLHEKNERSAKDGYHFDTANALWVQKDYALLPAFTERLKTQYDADAETIDFTDSAAASTINSWVEDKTERKIKNLIAPDALSTDTKLVLTNAVYFKADWKTPFEKSATQQSDFHINPAQNAVVQMMHRACKDCRYSQHENYQVLGIPYKGDDIEMVVFLPRDQNGLSEFEESFNPQTLREGLESLRQESDVDIFLPRFHIESQFSLKPVLQAMGMKLAFEPTHADFSGITGKPELYISDVIHKAYVDVDEEGTEAAAATGVVMVGALAILPRPNPVFRADHPFIFALHDLHTNAVYFLGRVEQPGS